MFISVIITYSFLFFGIGITIIGTPIVAVARLIDTSGRASHFLARNFLAVLSFLIGARVKVDGRENLDQKQKYLIISNHKSSADILILARVLPLHFKFFAASFLFSIPFFGWSMFLAGYLPINRSDRAQARSSILKGTNLLKDGKTSLLIFPEGTRSFKPEILPFKMGFLRIATETQRPILPLVIDGTEKVKRKDNFWYHPGRVRVSILPPVSTTGIGRENWVESRKKFENIISQEYTRIHDILKTSKTDERE